jgi:hypothetical protein
MESYLGVARAEGITEEEIGAVQSIVMAVAAGKVSAQLDEVRSRTKAELSADTPSPST